MSPSMSLNVTFLDFFCNDSLKLYVMFAEPPARSSIMFHFKIRGQTLLTPGKWLRCSYKTRWKETPTPPCTHTHTCSANHYFSKTISECLLIYPCPSRSHQCLHLSAIDLPAVCGIEELPIWESGNFSKKTRLLTTFSQIKIPRRHTGVRESKFCLFILKRCSYRSAHGSEPCVWARSTLPPFFLSLHSQKVL